MELVEPANCARVATNLPQTAWPTVPLSVKSGTTLSKARCPAEVVTIRIMEDSRSEPIRLAAVHNRQGVLVSTKCTCASH